MKKILLLTVMTTSVLAGFSQYKNNNNNNNNNNNVPVVCNDRKGSYNDNRNVGYNNQQSALVINSNSRDRIIVMIDNYQYQTTGNTVNITTLNPGKHFITIYEIKQGFFGKQRQKTIYNNDIFLKPNIETTLYLNGYRNDVSERTIYQAPIIVNDRRDHDRRENDRRDYDRRGDDHRH